ncbi:aldehyde dehydrogenase family protein [Streptomyces sp. SHP 1-2]|uniref:aldehyde dehydrogenase family protein n=1 Tax=Streptomyces sp. SHP 1-2 TaxID=2769489 RepID=UPI002237A0DA|nr:aldehyde dehydrogenase family protein [Streptomyces sp. SHP 1-2]MCW5251434.1 aldehyde dehydrogenase family protein [Streptomyces sp. SHP 1-2]
MTPAEHRDLDGIRAELAQECRRLVLAGRPHEPAGSAPFWVSAPGHPATQWTCAQAGPQEARLALDAAWKCFPSWSAQPVTTRAALVRRLADRIDGGADRYATAIAVEAGKSMAEARRETAFAVTTLQALADAAERMAPAEGERRAPSVTVRRRPVGPVLAITPWNFPLSLAARKVASALLAGCPVILKPSERTPVSALLLGRDLDTAGAPAGTVSVLPTTRSAELVAALTADPRLRKMSFTGSTTVGRSVLHATEGQLQRISLELGGNAPFVVCPRHDAGATADGLLAAKTANNGQACTAPNRLLLPPDAGDLTALLAERFENIRTGWSLDEESPLLGPLISAQAAARIDGLVADAKARGARVVRSRAELPEQGHFVRPALVLGAEPHWPIAREEIFGPVLPVLTYRDLPEAIRIANDTEYGLAGYVYGTAPGETAAVAAGLDTGLIAVNHPSVSHPAAPFGGTKHSGYGRENAAEGLSEYLSVVSIIGEPV